MHSSVSGEKAKGRQVMLDMKTHQSNGRWEIIRLICEDYGKPLFYVFYVLLSFFFSFLAAALLNSYSKSHDKRK